MRERVRDIDRLRHIEECINHVMDFLKGKTFEEMTKDFREEHPEVPWRDIVDMRNVLVHGYFTTSPLFIWETYTNDLGPLKEQVEQYIKELSQ